MVNMVTEVYGIALHSRRRRVWGGWRRGQTDIFQVLELQKKNTYDSIFQVGSI